jgi:hypothetical protein
VYLGSPSPSGNELFLPLDSFIQECYWSWLDELTSGAGEDYRGPLTYFNGDSPFTQPPLKVANEPRRLMGRGYDGCVFRVEC